ncbi:MAG: hypothetical protein IKU31_05130 [Oscillospiraceae bacterium]|nr:hypothetical protein [Oscillospiraceae bacterium]
MNKTIAGLLSGKAQNHMLPFFWQHGEDEGTLRHYMAVIQGANCHALCVESRPHPDFCGEGWWRDLDIILDEARKRRMQVWLLDDSHFPTGYANGAMHHQPDRLQKQHLRLKRRTLPGGKTDVPLELAQKDRLLLAQARNSRGESIDLTDHVTGGVLRWDSPPGEWELLLVVHSFLTEGRQHYINITEPESCRVLIDAVYEPHWQRYASDFGKTIAGFFSDEPELGNGPAYAQGNVLGTDQELPWGDSMEAAVSLALGEGWRMRLPLLWTEGVDAPAVRSIYMDCLTKLVREAFSEQLGGWCRSHGVRYIGHIIEDNGQHCRTGSSLGHYFRSLKGQDMSGIDNIGGQVLPQGEDDPTPYFLVDSERPAEFWHYALAKLAQSAAAIEPRKQRNAMCEIFGNYGWREGTRLEKYQADHFLVRGINQFVPHAFSPKAFPDPDCPPHFYANGHDPLYRHFGQLCAYINRAATLTSSGRHVISVAVLYHGESEWADSGAMPFEKPLRALYDAQIDCHVIPSDVFSQRQYYQTRMGAPLVVNGQRYHALVVPQTSALPLAAAEGLKALAELGLPIFFVNEHPGSIPETGGPLPGVLLEQPAVKLETLAEAVAATGISFPLVRPGNDRVRILQIAGDTPVYFLVNEGDSDFVGSITFRERSGCFLYDPWFNLCRSADFVETEPGVRVRLTLEPLKSVAVVFGPCDAPLAPQRPCKGAVTELSCWRRSTCPGIAYPGFGEAEAVTLPDDLSEEQPEFSGFVRYETEIPAGPGGSCILEISHADEAVECFLNGRSLGIRIAPPFRYDLTGMLTEEENRLTIEVATTLERQCYPLLDEIGRRVTRPPTGKTGLTGIVRLYRDAIGD